MFKHILVAIDGSEHSKQAVPAAIELAHHFDGDVFVLHVAEHDKGRAAAYTLESPAEATRLVADAVTAIKDAGVTAHGRLIDRAAGHVAKAIAETAEENASELIVMGTRGLSDAQGFMAGSVTHEVMRISRLPILVIRPAVMPAAV